MLRGIEESGARGIVWGHEERRAESGVKPRLLAARQPCPSAEGVLSKNLVRVPDAAGGPQEIQGQFPVKHCVGKVRKHAVSCLKNEMLLFPALAIRVSQ